MSLSKAGNAEENLNKVIEFRDSADFQENERK
jgi:hypothetical protein